MINSVHFTGIVDATPVLRRTKNDRIWVQLLVSVPTISRDRDGKFVEEPTLIPVSCFRNAGEQAKTLKIGGKITVIARLRGSKFTIESGTEKHGIQLVAERVFQHSIRDPFDIGKPTFEPRLEV